MRKTLLTRLVLLLFLAVVISLTVPVHAQTQTPPPPTFWEENSQAIIGALIGLIFGGILVWVLKPLFEKFGNALADALSRLGSGWGFKKRYLAYLIEEYRALNIRGLRDLGAKTNAVALEHVYVSLQAQAESDLRYTAPALTVGQALERHRRLSILGGPGSGKTTLLAYLTLTYSRKQTQARLGLRETYLPILVPLRQLKAVLSKPNGENTLPAYLTQAYTALGMHPREAFFERALESGRCLVLLDGLDEVADEAERRLMSEWVDGLATRYPKNRYMVTSRPPGYESAPLQNGFAVLRVRDFNDAEIRQFAQNWCLAVELAALGAVAAAGRSAQQEARTAAGRRAADAARDLTAAIAANPAIRKLAVNPLLLSIIALVHRYRATLPKRRVDLYAECVDVLLGHWDAAKGLAGTLAPGEKRAVLQAVALTMHRDGQREITRRTLEEHVARLLPTVGGKTTEAFSDAALFLDEVRDRSGLLVESGVNTYAFSHLTFQEYLCAREIVEAVDVAHSPESASPRTTLYRILDRRFDEEELRTFCFGLGVDYDDLPGRNQSSKARELTMLFERRGRLADLAAAVEQRGDIVMPPQASSPEPETPYALLLRHADEEWWQEVLLLYAGMTDATALVRDLTGFPNLSGLEEKRLLLAGRCVAEAGRLVPEVRQTVLRQLEDAFATCSGARFAQVGQVLAEIAGEDSVAFFLRVAHDDAKRRAVALDAVAEMARQPNEVLQAQVMAQLVTHLQKGERQQEAGVVLAVVWGPRTAREMRQLHIAPSKITEYVCSTMIHVPEGKFLYGDNKQPKTLPEFWIDRAPVTHADYKQFIDANPDHPVPYVDRDSAKPYNWDQQTRTYLPDKANDPVVLVSWHDAQAYAEWVGKSLPTEEEWEKAARGTDGREYPWSDTFDKEKCNTAESGIGGTTPVGKYSPQGDSPYGCVDMAGNVWEWTASDWSSTDKDKVLRGGSWRDIVAYARAADRHYCGADGRRYVIGFRCRSG